MPKILFLIIVLAWMPLQAQVKTNMDQMSELSNVASLEIIVQLHALSLDTVVLSFKGNSYDFLIQKALLANAGKIVFANKTGNSNNSILELNITEFFVEFINPDKDSVQRRSSLKLAPIIKLPSGEMKLLNTSGNESFEAVAWADAVRMNSTAPNFARGSLPERPVSLYKKLVEPIIVTTTAVLTIVLFFSIRSK